MNSDGRVADSILSGDVDLDGDLSLTGELTAENGVFTNDVLIEGDLEVKGAIVSDLQIHDSLWATAIENNTTDNLNMGYYSHYGPGPKYAGLIRNKTSKTFHLLNEDNTLPTSTGTITNRDGNLILNNLECRSQTIGDVGIVANTDLDIECGQDYEARINFKKPGSVTCAIQGFGLQNDLYFYQGAVPRITIQDSSDTRLLSGNATNEIIINDDRMDVQIGNILKFRVGDTTTLNFNNLESYGTNTFNSGVNSYIFPTNRPTINQVLKASDGVGNLEWATDGAGGDVVGPGASNNNNIALFDGITGKLIKTDDSTLNNGIFTLVGSGGINMELRRPTTAFNNHLTWSTNGLNPFWYMGMDATESNFKLTKLATGECFEIDSTTRNFDIKTSATIGTNLDTNNIRSNGANPLNIGAIQQTGLTLGRAAVATNIYGSTIFLTNPTQASDTTNLIGQLTLGTGGTNWTLPTTRGANNQILKSDGSGTMSFVNNTLSALGDISVVSPTNGQILTYSIANGWWENNDQFIESVSSLSDTTITAPTNNQVLTYNTGLAKWINQTPTAGGDVSGPVSSTDRAISIYNGATGKIIQDSNTNVGAAGRIEANSTIFTNGCKLTGTIARKITTTTVVNTLTETPVFTYGTPPSGHWQVGDTIKITMGGILGSGNNNGLQFKFQLHNGLFATGFHGMTLNMPGTVWFLEYVITLRTVGAGGSGYGYSHFHVDKADPSANEYMTHYNNIALDTTNTAIPLRVNVQWDTASASNTISVTNGLMQVI